MINKPSSSTISPSICDREIVDVCWSLSIGANSSALLSLSTEVDKAIRNEIKFIKNKIIYYILHYHSH